MALTATIYNFDIDLSDSDRGVYETVALRVAQHPSESDEYLIARVLAYLLEHAEGIDFSRGVSEPEEPMISVRDLTGKITSWIEIGTPDSARLHKASKAADRVAVYCHKERAQWLKGLAPPASTAPKRSSSTRSIATLDRRARVASRSADGLRRVDHRSRAVCLDWRRQPHRTRRAFVALIIIHGLRGLHGLIGCITGKRCSRRRHAPRHQRRTEEMSREDSEDSFLRPFVGDERPAVGRPASSAAIRVHRIR